MMLTRAYIKKEATTVKKALELSIKHWYENYRVTLKEMKRPYNHCEANMCGLCTFHDDFCFECILARKGMGCINGESLYQVAVETYNRFRKSRSKKNFKAWNDAAKAMWKFLVSLRGK